MADIKVALSTLFREFHEGSVRYPVADVPLDLFGSWSLDARTLDAAFEWSQDQWSLPRPSNSGTCPSNWIPPRSLEKTSLDLRDE